MHETSVGGSESFSLEDGISVQLNTSTQLIALASHSPQALKLRSGEVFLRVTRGPIDVTVGNLRINTAAASFGVRAYGSGDIDVMVLDGAVVVHYPAIETPHPSRNERPAAWPLSAGHLTSVRGNHVHTENAGEPYIERKLAWRNHTLAFLNEPIGNIVEEFNRYGRVQLLVQDPFIRELRVGGLFAPTDPAAFAAAVSELFTLEVETEQTRSGPVIRLLQTPKTSHTAPTADVPVPASLEP
jgi:transmembrane sensor